MCSETKTQSRQPLNETSLKATGLGKCYHVYDKPVDRLKQMLLPGGPYFSREQWSLRGVSFEARRGEVVGIVGRNGAGKSTLLQIVAGIVAPTEGRLERRGRTFSLLELGSGFNPEFTGIENVRTNAAILGLEASETAGVAGEVVEFADIGKYINEPVKTYSSGMQARLALSLALHLPAELLLIDEIISVGDVFFQMKCYERLSQLLESDKTVLLCSHDLGAVRRYCSRVLYLHGGRLLLDGDPDTVLTAYLRSGEECEPLRANSSGTNAAMAAKTEQVSQPTVDTPAVEAAPSSLPTASEWRPDDEFLSVIKSARGLAPLDNGNILVADIFSHGVYEVDRCGRIVSPWGEKGFAATQLYDPVALEVMPDGRIAAADYSSSRVVALDGGGNASELFSGAETPEQVFLVRYGPGGRKWVSSRGDSTLRIFEENGGVREVFAGDDKFRYVTDVAFRGATAYLADFANDEVLVMDALTLETRKVISLVGIEGARAPHGVALLDGHMLVTCHDSHSLLVMPIDDDGRSLPVMFNLAENLVEHPCYILVRGERAYVSASTLGGVVALDISDLLRRLDVPVQPSDMMQEEVVV